MGRAWRGVWRASQAWWVGMGSRGGGVEGVRVEGRVA